MDRERTGAFSWNYDRSEIIADGVIHALGVSLGLIGAITIIVIASQATRFVTIVSVLIYAVGCSRCWGSRPPTTCGRSHQRSGFRRFDHSAIYLLIAGTYTPFIAQLKITLASGGLLAGVWITAALGVVLKLVLPGRFDRMAVVLYVVLGWSGAMFGAPLIASFQTSTLWLLAAGGALYSIGLIVHLWRSLRFQNCDLACLRAARSELSLRGCPQSYDAGAGVKRTEPSWYRGATVSVAHVEDNAG